jgi:UDP-3-O-acyl-N-acetylglucosamine deacetylase
LLLERYDKCETKRDIRQSYIALPNEAARHKLLDVVGDLALMELKYKVKLSLINQGICKYNLPKRWLRL